MATFLTPEYKKNFHKKYLGGDGVYAFSTEQAVTITQKVAYYFISQSTSAAQSTPSVVVNATNFGGTKGGEQKRKLLRFFCKKTKWTQCA